MKQGVTYSKQAKGMTLDSRNNPAQQYQLTLTWQAQCLVHKNLQLLGPRVKD
jgi:hypothetical protein